QRVVLEEKGRRRRKRRSRRRSRQDATENSHIRELTYLTRHYHTSAESTLYGNTTVTGHRHLVV
ncbi:MAG: hypothetical protein FWG46_02295, partial [Treponema sp.]|nr:hypothetical protein [Treponema sp.]